MKTLMWKAEKSIFCAEICFLTNYIYFSVLIDLFQLLIVTEIFILFETSFAAIFHLNVNKACFDIICLLFLAKVYCINDVVPRIFAGYDRHLVPKISLTQRKNSTKRPCEKMSTLFSAISCMFSYSFDSWEKALFVVV